MNAALGRAAIGALLIAALAASAGSQQSTIAFATITYVSGRSVYVDAGERDGLVEGAQLDVLRRGAVVARLRAQYLSPGRAQCEAMSGAESIAVGDSVRYTRSARVASAGRDSTPLRPSREAKTNPRPRLNLLRGRIGFRYLASFERDSGRAQLAQPATDVRLDGSVPGLPSMEMSLDARARRTRTVSIDGVVSASRTATMVYQASLAWNAPAGMRLRLGRQYSPELAAVSLFDGGLLGLDRRHFAIGAFAGSQPDVRTMGYSSRVREYGAYASLRAAPAAGNMTVTTGAISSYDGAQVDREFGFLAASWYGHAASLYAMQELDYSRGWKEVYGTPMVSPTSTYISAHLRATDALSLRGGYDTRHNVRLYRNFVSPEISFDDTFRTGVWGGAHYEVTGYGGVSLDARRATGGPADTAAGATRDGPSDVYTASLATYEGGVLLVGLRSRSSLFHTPAASGWLQSVAIFGSPLQRLRLELGGGLRRDVPTPGTAGAAIAERLTVRWLQLDADVSLARAWYLMLSVSRERGGWEGNDQIYSSLTYRF